MLHDPDDDTDCYDDRAPDVEEFITQNPGASAVYVSDSLRIPLSAVQEIMLSLAR